MSIRAALIILAVAAVIVLLTVLDRWSRRPKRAAAPDCTLDTAWAHYVSHPDQGSERDRRAIASLEGSRERPPQELAQSLGETIDRALAAPEPLPVLREAIMDATDRFVMEESLFRPEDASEKEPAGAAPGATAALEAGVLRCYSRLRFADFAADDWYKHYLKVARMNAENVATMVEKTVSGSEASLESSLHQRLTGGMRQARAALLSYPAQTPVTPDAKLVGGGPVLSRRIPSQRQVELLTELVGDRMERLLGGQVYQVDGGSTVPPAIAIQVDTALLYTVLCEHFREPDESWRRILERTLGSQGGGAQSDALHDTAREVARQCAAEPSRGSFDAALAAACQLAAAGGTGASHREPRALAAAMRDDASFLAVSIHDIARQEG